MLSGSNSLMSTNYSTWILWTNLAGTGPNIEANLNPLFTSFRGDGWTKGVPDMMTGVVTRGRNGPSPENVGTADNARGGGREPSAEKGKKEKKNRD